MRILGIVSVLLGTVLGLFHFVYKDPGLSIVPKASFSYSDTFVSLEDVLHRYNNRSPAEAFRGDPSLDNLMRHLQERGVVVNSPKTTTSKSDEPSRPAPAPQLSDLSKYLVEHPWDLFKDPLVEAKFKKLLGSEYDLFLENLQVAGPVQLLDGFYTGQGCKPHQCGSDASAFTIHKETGAIAVTMLVDSDKPKLIGANSVKDLPAPLYEWYKEHGGLN